MNKEELNSKLDNLKREFDLKELQIIREYCFSNNPYNVGDIFTDHIGSIIIEKIQFNRHDKSCVYTGVELNKKGQPNKRGNKRQAFQTNDINKK